jgi:hypothetical protein
LQFLKYFIGLIPTSGASTVKKTFRIKKVGGIDMVQIEVPKSRGKEWGGERINLSKPPLEYSYLSRKPVIGRNSTTPRGKIRGLS